MVAEAVGAAAVGNRLALRGLLILDTLPTYPLMLPLNLMTEPIVAFPRNPYYPWAPLAGQPLTTSFASKHYRFRRSAMPTTRSSSRPDQERIPGLPCSVGSLAALRAGRAPNAHSSAPLRGSQSEPQQKARRA